MREAMRRRGPDGEGAWWSGDRRCGLGHRRLSILDLSERASQPMVSQGGRFVVTFNGEIYNYPALRAELEACGIRFRTSSDTEALLHLYRRFGEGMVRRLRGMFAFALWDERRRELFLARDPYGIKPLYCANDGFTFRFASQVKALLAGGRLSREPEPAGIAGFHLFGSVPEPYTFYREIRALPAGHTQKIDSAGPREPRPFQTPASILAEGASKPAPRPRHRPGEIEQGLRAAAAESVRAHLLADVEVGLFLSAGVDSAAILALMRGAGEGKIRAITLAFDEFHGSEEDEAPLASRLALSYGAHHIVRRVGEREFRDDLPAILEAMDQPSIDGVNTWFVAKAAKEAGLKVALSGLGGDELLGGYPSFVDLPQWRRRFGPLAALPGFGRFVRVLTRALLPDLAERRPKALALLEYAHRWSGVYLLRRGLFLPHELARILGPDLAREGLFRLQPLRHLERSLVPDPGSNPGRVCALESAHYLKNQLLRDADWAGMAHGVEIRTPFVDAALLAKMAPAIGHLRPGLGKAALARTPSPPLPEVVLHRKKTGFAVPMGVWTGACEGVPHAGRGDGATTKGLASRRWSHRVLQGFA
jgi:asparagine synthase (glutamine-hydrolysing)